MPTQFTSSWLPRLAALTAGVTVVLIIAGALVTSTGSGDSVPDWPLAYGKLIPPLIGGVQFEYSHRVVAGTTGILVLILALFLWRKESRKWVRYLGLGALVAVIVQALLGGLRVLVISQQPVQDSILNITGASHVTPIRIAFSVIHASLAQIVLCLTFALATVTSSAWQKSPVPLHSPDERARLSRLSTLVIGLVFLQLIIGALMRHVGAGLAIPDFPWSFGRLIPDFNNLPYDANAALPLTYQEVRFRVLVHFAHRAGAFVIAIAVLSLATYIFRHFRNNKRLIHLGWMLMTLTLAQIMLGAFAIWTKKGIPVTVAHVTTGAMILGISIVLRFWAARIQSRRTVEQPASNLGVRAASASTFSNYLELTKPRISFLVLVTTLAGFYLGSNGSLNLWLLANTLIATALVTAGTNALNMVLERDVDGRMQRTKNRPLPAGRIESTKALWFGILISVAGILHLTLTVNILTSSLAALALGTYLFIYTPLKRKSWVCTIVGAVSGAIPPMMGWTAVRNQVGIEALTLFGILFLWQIPHFYAIAWIYRDDYARAGFSMLSASDPLGKRTAFQIIIYTVGLLAISLVPSLIHLSGLIYLSVAFIIGAGFVTIGIFFRIHKSILYARRFFIASIIYLPALLTLMVFDKLASL